MNGKNVNVCLILLVGIVFLYILGNYAEGFSSLSESSPPLIMATEMAPVPRLGLPQRLPSTRRAPRVM